MRLAIAEALVALRITGAPNVRCAAAPPAAGSSNLEKHLFPRHDSLVDVPKTELYIAEVLSEYADADGPQMLADDVRRALWDAGTVHEPYAFDAFVATSTRALLERGVMHARSMQTLVDADAKVLPMRAFTALDEDALGATLPLSDHSAHISFEDDNANTDTAAGRTGTYYTSVCAAGPCPAEYAVPAADVPATVKNRDCGELALCVGVYATLDAAACPDNPDDHPDGTRFPYRLEVPEFRVRWQPGETDPGAQFLPGKWLGGTGKEYLAGPMYYTRRQALYLVLQVQLVLSPARSFVRKL